MGNISLDKLGDAIIDLTESYVNDIESDIDKAAEHAAQKLVDITQKTAPVGKRKRYRKKIACKKLDGNRSGAHYVWYVKPPDHRLTHLVVHGHATKNGGRTKGNPFLKNACDAVFPEFEADVEKAVKRQK